ncbi:MAG TPA: ABC transporter permease subunit [Gemmataceae bacterium]|nr:ABC transporter permease subunit [Gemmataceae bacterium]
MTTVILWREYRRQRGLWFVFALLASIVAIGLSEVLAGSGRLPQSKMAQESTAASVFIILAVLAGVYGVAVGASLLAGDKEDGTLAFLDRLPGHRTSVFTRKLLAGLLLTLSQGLVYMVLNLWFGLGHWPSSLVMFVVTLHGMIWGLLGGAIWPSSLPALGCGIWFVIFSNGVIAIMAHLLGMDEPRVSRFAGFAGLTLVGFSIVMLNGGAVYLAWRRYARKDLLRRWGLAPGAYRVLRWLAYRQSRHVIYGCVAMSVLLCFLVHPAPLLWPFGMLAIGVACGLAVFMPQQRAASLFFGCQRFPPGKVWTIKILIWAAICCACIALPMTVAAMRWAADTRDETPDGVPLGNRFLLLATWPLYGFAIGLFCGQVTQREFSAIFLAVVISPCAAILWAPSLLLGDVPVWWALSIPFVLLLTTRLLMRPWMSRRLWSGRPALGIAVIVGLCIVILGGFLWHRAVQIPDVGMPFDAIAFNTALETAKNHDSGALLRNANRTLKSHQKTVNEEIGVGITNGFNVRFIIHDQEGWPSEDKDLAKWLDRLFEGEWAQEATKAASMPLGLLIDPRVASSNPHDWRDAREYREMVELFVLKALQLQASGDSRGALDKLETALAISRQMGNYAPMPMRLTSIYAQNTVMAGWQVWLDKTGPAKDLVQRGSMILQQHAAVMPPAADTPKAEFLIYRNNDFQLPDGKSFHEQMMRAAFQAPWEKERLRRMGLAVTARQIRFLEKPSWTASDWEQLCASEPILRPGWINYSMEGVFHDSAYIRTLAFGDQYLATQQIVTAVAHYHVDHGRLPGKLVDLTPVYLPTLPVNRFDGQPFGYAISKGEMWWSSLYGRNFMLPPGQAVITGVEASREGRKIFAAPVPSWAK